MLPTEANAAEERLISIGELARLCCVTQRTLRHYQSKGLLEPAYIDEQTGYRYYAVEQTRDLQAVKLLSTLGLTLEEIAQLFNDPAPGTVTARIEEGLAAIERRKRELSLASYLGNELISSHQLASRPLVFDTYGIEHLNRRLVRSFSVSDLDVPDDLDRAELWAHSESKVERILLSEGLVVLCRNIGGIISAANLAKPLPEFDHIFVAVNDDIAIPAKERLVIDEGDFITFYQKHYQASDTFHFEEMEKVASMQGHAQRLGYEIIGDYYCEALVTAPLMGYKGYDCLSRLSAPVRKRRSDAMDS